LVKDQPNQQPSITVLSPKDGDVWEMGKTYTISWQGPMQQIILYSETDSGGMDPNRPDVLVNYSPNVINNGNYNYIVVAPSAPGYYKLGVVSNGTNISSLVRIKVVSQSVPACPTATTKPGDANCDGKVNQLDYDAINKGFNSGGTLTGWANGDFDGNGKINFDDYFIINQAFLGPVTTTPTTSYVDTATQIANSIQAIRNLLNQLGAR